MSALDFSSSAQLSVERPFTPKEPLEGRWDGITRPYGADDVHKLSGSYRIEHTVANRGACRLWQLLNTEPYVAALGAVTGNQAMQQVRAGLKAIYLSGWQVAADNNAAASMYPDQSLYPVDSGAASTLALAGSTEASQFQA